MKIPSSLRIAALANVATALTIVGASMASAAEAPCPTDAPCAVAYVLPAEPTEPSWIFRRGTFTNDPETGARVAQYMRTPPVEPLDDPRAITSRYTRRRTNLRGANGSLDTYYEVQNWGNGRGGLDAEWERVNDAWQDSYLQGGFYNQSPWGFGGNQGGWGSGYGYGQPGYGFSGGLPGGGFGPGFGNGPGGPGYGGGQPGYGVYQPGYGQPPYSNNGGGHGQPSHGGGRHRDHGPHHGSE